MSRAANPATRLQAFTIASRKPPGGMACPCGSFSLMKGDLHAGNARHAAHPREQSRGRMTILWTMRPEQYHAISVAPLPIGESLFSQGIEAHHRIQPTRTVEVRPLIAHAQVHLDHPGSDRVSRFSKLTSSFHRTLSYLNRYTLVFPPTLLKFTLNPFQIHSDRATPTLHVTRISPRTSSWLQDRSQSLLK